MRLCARLGILRFAFLQLVTIHVTPIQLDCAFDPADVPPMTPFLPKSPLPWSPDAISSRRATHIVVSDHEFELHTSDSESALTLPKKRSGLRMLNDAWTDCCRYAATKRLAKARGRT